MVFLNELFI
ncbi:hypothetical protein CFP56_036196 [Quercus suber]|uniref:Uncharacterized protein n=1 Tax=Quercus suber TaxID=58331 RepID=A0AAW0J7I4_QUESU